MSDTPGYLYVFNESLLEENKLQVGNKEPTYNILFPTPNANKGKAKIGKNDEVTTMEGLFDEKSVTERIWIIWTLQEEPLLTDLIKRALQGEVSSNDAQSLNDYLRARGINKVKAETDNEKGIMRLRFNSEEMIYAMEITYVGQ